MARRRLRRSLFVLVSVAIGAAALLAMAYLALFRPRLETYEELANYYARKVGLDPALVLAVIHAESAGKPRAVSPKGARGLMQLMPSTARAVAQEAGVALRSDDDLFDPELNVRLGTVYLAKMRRRFDDDPHLYVAAYNAGPTRMAALRRRFPRLSSRELVAQKAPGETRAYVRRVLRTWQALEARD